MTDTMTSTDLGTPADVADAVLDAIEANPDAFSMSDWCRLPGGTPLPPRVAPPSGSTLCAAAWVAHLTGRTLVDADDLVQVTVRLPGGFEYQRYAYSYARRNGEQRSIANVADVALGLEPGHGLWIGSADTALWRLRQIAGR
ncbi:hypothetical protein OOK58_00070 [Streptomyces sp. NBC_01728]|uniref:hypothetical protein n=1 Tax=unclassified Streptomyces TaxID=2593676 RepID=UPI00225AB15F|nr:MULTISPECIES: hypothetical protein [unclassified Streptomyces]MCX4462468.1 hypothetical protein [Streptomyces sp. NBC_01719]MCX4490028.1 hypothetical protein [Streptomyces sp. NBC_01728]